MITTSVKETGIQNMAFLASASQKGTVTDKKGDFQNVLDKQTQTPGKKGGSDVKSAGDAQKDRAEKVMGMKNGKREILHQKGSEELPEEENIAVTAQEAAMELLLTASEIFEMPVTQLEETMETLGIEPTELLDPETLSEILLTAAGAKGQEDLLTDADLYGKFREVMEFGNELREQVEDLPVIPQTDMLKNTGSMEPVPEAESGEMISAESVSTKEFAPQQNSAMQNDGSGSFESGSELQNARNEEPRVRKEESAAPVQSFAEATPLGQLQDQIAEEITVSETTETQGSDTENIMRQIMDYMRVQVKPEATELEMHLHPASLGSIQIHLTSRGGAVTAQFIAQTEAVREALETQMIRLQQSFEEQGVKIDAIEVAVQAHSFERNLDEQGRQGTQQQARGGRGVRRLRADDAVSGSEQEYSNDEERLAAEMMAAGGGTVDFTA